MEKRQSQPKSKMHIVTQALVLPSSRGHSPAKRLKASPNSASSQSHTRPEALTRSTRLGDDGRHGDGLDDGSSAGFGGAGGDAADAQDGRLGPRPTGLRGGNDSGGLAIC